MRRAIVAIALMGSTSVFSLALGALRMKLIALNLGAAGVGSVALLVAATTTMAVVLGLGLGVSAISSLASASIATEAQRIRVALRRGTLVAAALGSVTSTGGWLIYSDLTADGLMNRFAPWVGVSVAAGILAARYTAILSATRRVGGLAAANVMAASLGTVAFLVALHFYDDDAVIATAVMAPTVSLLLAAAVVVTRLEPERRGPTGAAWIADLSPMVKVGLAVSSASVMINASQLFAVSWVTRDLGISGAGYFQASWSIGHLYLTFMLSALTAEYLPRLAALAGDRVALQFAMDQQVRLLLVLAAPAIAWVMILSPYLLALLYEADFEVAAGMLRLQLMGDVFKVAAWALSFTLIATQKRWRYFIGEVVWNASFITMVVVLAGRGLQYVGLAYAMSYVIYALVTARQTRFRPSGPTLALGATVMGGLVAVYILLINSPGSWMLPSAVAATLTAGSISTVAASKLFISAVPAASQDR